MCLLHVVIMTNMQGIFSQLKNPQLLEIEDSTQMQHNNLVITVWNNANPVRRTKVVCVTKYMSYVKKYRFNANML